MTEIDPRIVPDVEAWRGWLDANEETSDGVWLVLAKKGVTDSTSVTYALALDEALCSGWIDGPKRGRDAATHLQRFTPRRRASLWSQRNVGIVERLAAEGRMRPRGQAEIDRAFARANKTNRYAVIHRLITAPNDATRARRLERLVGMLARGDYPYPQ